MKVIKSVVCAIMAIVAVALCAATARATGPGIGTVANSTPLTVAITLTTNTPDTFTTNAAAHTVSDNFSVAKVTINNTYLLNLFAHWDKMTNWPSGAKLVVGWDVEWNGDVLVVDKTGTNVLFDANDTPTNYFRVDYFSDYGSASWKSAGSSFNFTSYYDGYFELYDDNVYLPCTKFSGYGAATTTFIQDTTTWSDTSYLTAGYNGEDELFMNHEGVTVSGTANTTGLGKGDNEYLDGIFDDIY